MNKSELRVRYLQLRQSLSPQQLEDLSLRIVDTFEEEVPLEGINVVHIFYPIPGKQEFNTLLLKQHLEDKNPDLSFVLPKADISSNTLSHILWEKETALSMNQWGITEPEFGTPVPIGKIDMVIIPLLVYDKRGHRIGYGKGFYDRFLADCNPSTLKVGVSFFEPEDGFDEIGHHDVPLDMCVTPDKVWRFTANDP